MKSILTKADIREICLDNGFSLKEQPGGEMDLNPYVYNAAAALVERALKSTLVSNQRNLQTIVEKGPGAALSHYSYTDVCPQYVKDHRTLWAMVEKLQGSLVLRRISSTNLYNAVVVDKHDMPIAAALNKPLGEAMAELIQHTRDLLVKAESVPNQPFFPAEREVNGVVVTGDEALVHTALTTISGFSRQLRQPVVRENYEENKMTVITVAGDPVDLGDVKIIVPSPDYNYNTFDTPDFLCDCDALNCAADYRGISIDIGFELRDFNIRVGGLTVKGKTICDTFTAALALVLFQRDLV